MCQWSGKTHGLFARQNLIREDPVHPFPADAGGEGGAGLGQALAALGHRAAVVVPAR